MEREELVELLDETIKEFHRDRDYYEDTIDVKVNDGIEHFMFVLLGVLDDKR